MISTLDLRPGHSPKTDLQNLEAMLHMQEGVLRHLNETINNGEIAKRIKDRRDALAKEIALLKRMIHEFQSAQKETEQKEAKNAVLSPICSPKQEVLSPICSPEQEVLSPLAEPMSPRLPRGSWRQSARNYKVNKDGDGFNLVAELRDRRGGWHKRTVYFRARDELENLDGKFNFSKIINPGETGFYGDYEKLPELDFGGKFDVTSMDAKTLDVGTLAKIMSECEKRKCNVFVVANGRAYLKRVVIAHGRPVHKPNRIKTCTMYVHKSVLAAIKGDPQDWDWTDAEADRQWENAVRLANQKAGRE